MRSIIHEASTVAKALEQGWIKAGKPKDFSVKIFEEPEKNFLGFTTKNAKIGIFVEDRQQQDHHRKHSPQRKRHHRQGQWRRPYQGQDQRPYAGPRNDQRQHDAPRDDQKQQRPDFPRDRDHDDENKDQ